MPATLISRTKKSKSPLRGSAKELLPTQATEELKPNPESAASVQTLPTEPKTHRQATPAVSGSATETPDEAMDATTPIMPLSHPATEGAAGQARCGKHASTPLTVPPALILQMRERHVHRQAAIRAQIRIENQCRSLVRRAMGWRIDLSDADRSRINRASAKLVKLIESSKPIPEDEQAIADAVRPFCIAAMSAREPFDAYRDKLEKQLVLDAETLPVWTWAKQVRGFSANLLSVIVGEAGDIGGYSGPRKLWKRLGLAPKECYRMETKGGETAFAIPRARRAAIWVIGDCLIKQNQGKYRQLYDERKAYETQRAPDMSKMHAHRRAQRYMEKRFIQDLWAAWRFGQHTRGSQEVPDQAPAAAV